MAVALTAGAALTAAIVFGVLPPAGGLLALAIVLGTGFWRIRAHVAPILCVFFAVLLLTTVVSQQVPRLGTDRVEAREGDQLARTWAESGSFDRRLPIVLHLVFDEMMSTGAMSEDLPGGRTTRDSWRSFAATHGFRLFDSVYSRYFFSGEALPNLMSPEYRGRTALSDVYLQQQFEHGDNAYFVDLEARGYRTAVFQTSLMKFCDNGAVDLCETFESHDPAMGGRDHLDARNQTAHLWQTVLRAYEPSYVSELGQSALRHAYGLRSGEAGALGVADRYDVQGFARWFDRFATFAPQVPRGTHLFAHFMVPHSPYLLTETCIVSGRFEAGYYLTRYSASERGGRRQQYYDAYLAQLRCVQRKLDELMLALAGAPQFADALIVIHGDHGSRISSGNILEDLSEQDFIDNYATFFALRAPTVTPGIDCEFLSLPQVFRRQVASPSAPPAAASAPLPIVIESRGAGNRKVEAPMPVFGCGALDADER
jgi:hypothetical protein